MRTYGSSVYPGPRPAGTTSTAAMLCSLFLAWGYATHIRTHRERPDRVAAEEIHRGRGRHDARLALVQAQGYIWILT